jgi:hypothetical protein
VSMIRILNMHVRPHSQNPWQLVSPFSLVVVGGVGGVSAVGVDGGGGVSVALCNPCLSTNACKDSGFAFDLTGGECSAAQVLLLICHIIMSDMDKAANFAQQCMLDQHLSHAAIAGSRHIQQGMVVPEADVVPPFVCRQAGTI